MLVGSQGGLGRTSIFDYGDLLKLWERLRVTEFPPKLPSETRGIRKFFGGLLEFFTEPSYVLPPREEIEKAMAAAFQEEQRKREAAALEEERQRFREEMANRQPEEEPKEAKVDPNLF